MTKSFVLSRKDRARDERTLAHAPAAPRPASAGPVADLLTLQRTAGNRAVNRLIPAKLRVNTPGDEGEREVDRLADAVNSDPEPGLHKQVATA